MGSSFSQLPLFFLLSHKPFHTLLQVTSEFGMKKCADRKKFMEELCGRFAWGKQFLSFSISQMHYQRCSSREGLQPPLGYAVDLRSCFHSDKPVCELIFPNWKFVHSTLSQLGWRSGSSAWFHKNLANRSIWNQKSKGQAGKTHDLLQGGHTEKGAFRKGRKERTVSGMDSLDIRQDGNGPNWENTDW